MVKRLLSLTIFTALIIIAVKYMNGTPFANGSERLHSSRQSAITRAIKKVAPAVVGINVTQLKQKRSSSLWDPFFLPYTRTYKVDNLGSGVIISADGYVITNYHVVDGANEIVVTLSGGKRFEANLVGLDNLTDVALLKIEGEGLPFAELGTSDDLIVGEWAIALGNPLGLFVVSLTPTATAGIISGVDMDFGLKDEGHVYQDMIQTDASINSGNSGGPLVNTMGQVIGINAFILTGSNFTSGSIGIGFSIPINRVKDVVDDLKVYGKVERSYNTGIHVQAVDKFIQRYLRLPSQDGVLVRDVEKRSSGERAGLQIGDVILRVDDRIVSSPQDIIRVIDEGFRKVGDMVELTIWRENSELKKQLKLEEPQSKTWGF